jgi:hypothetical protein
MHTLLIFPNPLDATCELRHDTGWVVMGTPAVHSSGRKGQRFTIPAGTPQDNGCQLTITAIKKVPVVLRGILTVEPESYLRVDDFTLQDATVTLPRLVVSGQFLAQEDV